jgi:redox-sensitive bicupin YhaK (pirin superfamily)
VEQVIRPGEVNWMTAGSGIAHSERFEDPSTLAQSRLELLQTWVALPEKDEESAPSFNNYQPEQLPVFTDRGIWMRQIAGSAYGLKSEVKTHSPLFYFHVVLEAGARFPLTNEYSERGVYIVKGKLEISGHTYSTGQMITFRKGADAQVMAMENTVIMLLGGEPLGERFIWWNFVSSRKERIEQAKSDWQQGKILLPPNDNKEFIPLPKDKSRPSDMPPPELLS